MDRDLQVDDQQIAMLIECHIIGHAEATHARRLASEGDAHYSSTTFVGKVDRALSIDRSTNVPHYTQGQQYHLFAIDAKHLHLPHHPIPHTPPHLSFFH